MKLFGYTLMKEIPAPEPVIAPEAVAPPRPDWGQIPAILRMHRSKIVAMRPGMIGVMDQRDTAVPHAFKANGINVDDEWILYSVITGFLYFGDAFQKNVRNGALSVELGVEHHQYMMVLLATLVPLLPDDL